MGKQIGQRPACEGCIGIIILNYRNWDDTRQCVISIHRNPPKADYRIFLVDNASDNAPGFDLTSFIEKYRIVFIQNRQNTGYNAGNNIGIAKALQAGCSYVLISNNDVRYFPGSIQAMKDCLDMHPENGIVGPKILEPNGCIQKSHMCRRTGMKEKYMVRTRAKVVFRKSYRSYFGLDRDYEQPFEIYAAAGCCFMISRQCAEVVMPFDEYPLLYEEELMLGIRMKKMGYRTRYEPKAVIEHLHGQSTRYQKAFAFTHNVRSEIYYCRKYLHAGKWQVYPLYWYRVLLYLARCLWQKDFRRSFRWFLKTTSEEFRQF